jgi:hypothetical protein
MNYLHRAMIFQISASQVARITENTQMHSTSTITTRGGDGDRHFL